MNAQDHDAVKILNALHQNTKSHERKSLEKNSCTVLVRIYGLQCFVAVGWAAGKASSL